MTSLIAVLSGFIFSLGLGLGGMTQPGRVIGFLDFFGSWDPTLMAVMAGAIVVYATGFHVITRKPKPMFSDVFHTPPKSRIDRALVVGSALFGIGWGIAGYCPGPALVSLTTLSRPAFIFVFAMVVGINLHTFYLRVIKRGKP